MDYDVVVVGAGPAGSITAKVLAENGIKVLAVEKRPEIGMPVRCGEAVGIAGLKELDIKINRKFVANETKGAYLYSPSSIKVEMLSDKPNGYILERRIFDKYLAIHAARAGAEIRTKTYAVGLIKEAGFVKGVKLKYFDEEYEVRCGCVVGADGVEGKIGRWAGIDTRTPLSEMISNVQFEIAGIDVNSEILEFYFGSKIAPGGYAWIFPKGKDVANVGLGIRNSSTTALEYLKRFVNSKKNLRQGSIIGIIAGGVPVQGPAEKTAGNGVVLVGDAARQVDPLTGGGIYNAMRCATIAAEVIKEAAEKNNFSETVLLKYDKVWKESIGGKLLKSLRVKQILEKLTDSELDAIAKAMHGLNLGEVDIKDVAKSLIKMPPELISFIKLIVQKS